MFAWSKEELNDEQSNAVTNSDSILLIACPGSGKTRTLTYKIAYELSKLESKKQYIVAITYTNRAADEIKDRVELFGVDVNQLWIGTIHSFCLEWILRPYSLYLPKLKNGFKVINSFDSEKIIKELCKRYNETNSLSGGQKVTYWNCSYYATAEPKFQITKKDGKCHKARTVLLDYFKILSKNNQIDFEQILFYSLKLLKNKPVISKVLSKIFPQILIDEYQDTKEIQYHIICSIIKENAANIKLFVVGDPNQSIYQNLGGYPIKKNDLEKLSGLAIKALELKENYRSSVALIDYFKYFKTYNNNIVPVGKHKNFKSLIHLNNAITKDNLIDYISNLIKYNIEKLGISQNEICIVAPQWVHLASATRNLMLKLPGYSFDGPGMAPFSRDIENFWFKLSRIVLTEASPNMYVRRIRWSSEILKELNEARIDTSKITPKKFLKVCNSININKTDGLEYLADFFNEIFNRFSVNINSFPSLQEHYKSFFESSKDRIDKLLRDGIDYISKIETFKKVFQQRKGITVSTCHGIKGTEFDTVIAFALLQNYIPHFSDPNGSENSKKLLYVIASRARKNLYLIAEKERFNNWRQPVEYTITKHLDEYKFKYTETVF